MSATLASRFFAFGRKRRCGRTPLAERLEDRRLLTTITSGQRLPGHLAIGGSDEYTFSATAGDPATVLAADVSNGSFSPHLTLYAPDGSIVDDSADSDVVVFEISSLPQTGMYRAVVQESGGDVNGDYLFSMFHVPAVQHLDDDSSPIAPGQRLFGKIDRADLDVYTFTASAGQSFFVIASSLGDGSGSLYPIINVYDPSGALINSAGDRPSPIAQAADLAESGTYTVVLHDFRYLIVGEYAITLALYPGAVSAEYDSDGGAISSGESRTASFSRGDIDMFTVPLSAGANTAIDVTVTQGAAHPNVGLYKPDGTLVTEDFSSSGHLHLAASNLPVSGDYIVRLTDVGRDNWSDYVIAIDSAPDLTDTTPPRVTSANFNYLHSPHHVDLNLSENLGTSFSEADLTVANLSSGALSTTDYEAVFDRLMLRLTIEFPSMPDGILPDGNYRTTLSAGSVTDSSGNALAEDGVFDFFVLSADANHDRHVDTNDFMTLAQNFNKAGPTFAEGDFNYDGKVNALDFNILATRFGTHLAPPTSAAHPLAGFAAGAPRPSLFADSTLREKTTPDALV